jgi:hypothetical protein
VLPFNPYPAQRQIVRRSTSLPAIPLAAMPIARIRI